MAKVESRSTFIANLAGKAKEAFKTLDSKEDGETGLIGRTVEKGVEKGIASFERKARNKLPDAGILAGGGLIILLLLGAIFYWARK